METDRQIILLGTGGHARSCIDVIEQNNNCLIAGLVEKKDSKINLFSGYPILGSDEDLNDLRKKYKNVLIALGQIRSPEMRKTLYFRLKVLKYFFPVIISPLAYVSSNAEIGEGTIVMHGAIVNAGAKIGANCIINSTALIEHDAVIGDHCHVATGAIINGGVKINQGTFIGSGSRLKQKISIGKNCVIGIGSIVKQNIIDNQVVQN